MHRATQSFVLLSTALGLLGASATCAVAQEDAPATARTTTATDSSNTQLSR